MCLSTVYRNEKDESNILMKNVCSVSMIEGKILLKDIMVRTILVRGSVQQADLMENFILIKEEQ